MEAGLQLLRREVLVLVLRARVEHVKQGLLCKVRHFLLNRLRVPDSVALWQVELWLWWLWWLVASERESLFGNATAVTTFQQSRSSTSKKMEILTPHCSDQDPTPQDSNREPGRGRRGISPLASTGPLCPICLLLTCQQEVLGPWRPKLQRAAQHLCRLTHRFQ